MDKEILDILERSAIQMENKIKEKILSNIPPPNVEETIRRKGSSSTLIDTGAMLNSVTHRLMESQEEFEIGIFDEEILRYALINEFGEGNTPERSFLRSSWDENIDQITRECASEIADVLIKKLSLK
jgi:hypothetical protein